MKMRDRFFGGPPSIVHLFTLCLLLRLFASATAAEPGVRFTPLAVPPIATPGRTKLNRKWSDA